MLDKQTSPPSDSVSAESLSFHLRAWRRIDAMLVFSLVKIFGSLAYDKRYLTGKYFSRFYSPGWRWAFNGMFAKLFTGAGRGVPWPVSSQGTFGSNVVFHVDDINVFQGSSYFQTFNGGKITLGRGTWIARGCSLITSNHDMRNPDLHQPAQDIVIGEKSWLGANVVVMPGVVLGPHTVVGANAVVTKSFPEGYCVLGGVPARILRTLDRGT